MVSMPSSHPSLSLCVSLSLSFSLPVSFILSFHKPAVDAHTHILHTYIRSAAITLTHKAAHQWVSGRRLPWQHIPSHVAAWSGGVMLLNQPPLSALHCCLTCMLLHRNLKMVQSRSPDVHILTPQTRCHLVEYRTSYFLSPALCLFPQYVILLYMHQLWWNCDLFCVMGEAMSSTWCRHEI